MRCEIFIGRLVSHPCAKLTAQRCDMCGRPACHRHMSQSAPTTCAVCTQEYRPPGAPVEVTMDEMLAFDDGDFGAFDAGAVRHRTPWADS